MPKTRKHFLTGLGLLICLMLALGVLLNACQASADRNDAHPKNFHKVNDDIFRSGR